MRIFAAPEMMREAHGYTEEELDGPQSPRVQLLYGRPKRSARASTSRTS